MSRCRLQHNHASSSIVHTLTLFILLFYTVVMASGNRKLNKPTSLLSQNRIEPKPAPVYEGRIYLTYFDGHDLHGRALR